MRTIYFAALLAFTQAARQSMPVESVDTENVVVEEVIEDVQVEDVVEELEIDDVADLEDVQVEDVVEEVIEVTDEDDGAPDLLEIFDGDDSFHGVEKVDTSVTDIDFTVTEATNIKGNKDEKIDYVEFDWDQFALTDWDFSDLLDLVQNDEAANTLIANWKTDLMNRYTEEVANLPEVCEPGRACRQEIRAQLQATVRSRWYDMVSEIKEMIADVGRATREHLESAYSDAFYCDHGCECQFVENTYSYLLTQIEEYEAEIVGWQSEITVLQGRIDGVPYECEAEFAGYKAQYESEWTTMANESDMQIAALDDWTSDGWNMDSAVDQDRFEEEFGFRYSSERFDSYMEDPEYYEAVAGMEV